MSPGVVIEQVLFVDPNFCDFMSKNSLSYIEETTSA